MTFFFVLFIVSFGGIAVLYVWHRMDLEEIAASYATPARYRTLCMSFMESITGGMVMLWRMYIWGHMLRFIEKRLRWIRIIILKIERLLFRATHRLRAAVQQHENGAANGAHGDHNANNKNVPP